MNAPRMRRLALVVAIIAVLSVAVSPVVAKSSIVAPTQVAAGEPFTVTGAGAEPGRLLVLTISTHCDPPYALLGQYVAADGTWSEEVPGIDCVGQVKISANEQSAGGFRIIARATVRII